MKVVTILYSKKKATYITKPKEVIPNLVQLEVAKERGFYGLANAMPQRTNISN